jgi:hypothetical protein
MEHRFAPPAAVGRALAPEQRLALAVLQDAVADFQRHAFDLGPRFAEMRDWIFSDDASWPFTFVNLCSALDLDPSHLRCGLAGWLIRAHAEAPAGNVGPFERPHRTGTSRARVRPLTRSRRAAARRDPERASSGRGRERLP